VPASPAARSPFSIVVVGASWGGLNALSVLVAGLPLGFDIPLVLIQHRSKESHSLLEELLQDHTPLTVLEVEDKQPIAPGHVYLAPADYHLLVEGSYFSLTVDEPVRFSRPSIDVTFASAADTCGAEVIGVVLTGANEDGAAGLRRIVDRGGRGVVQDPATAEVRTMPAAAIRAVPEADVLALDGIAARIAALVAGNGTRLGRIDARRATGEAESGGARRSRAATPDLRPAADARPAPSDRPSDR
jgi:two-component system chemotaxis response regulator CheB